MALKVIDLDAKREAEKAKNVIQEPKDDGKMLGEMTLGELKTLCNNTICDKCNPKIREFCHKLLDNEGGYMPAYWELEDKLSDV